VSRPSTAAAALLAVVLVALTTSPAASLGDERPSRPVPAGTTPAARALDRAVEVLDGGGPSGASPTLVLRDLVLARPALSPSQRAEADGLLARPTQGANDPNHDGYTVPARRTCTRRLCVHWVRRTADAPPNRDWVDRTMAVLERTWSVEVGRLGYRRPLKDGSRGGNSKFDVYLKDVGDEGYYGYCAPERSSPDNRWVKSGYCVLDDDFARSQFDAKPLDSLKVTAAHEFFHAVQFAYDYGEDGWLMEATATWMEENVADGVNDNRQYLRYGQVAQPSGSLDVFKGQSGFDQYGNWAFFSYLATRFGPGIVKKVWANASGDWRNHSVKAVRTALPASVDFPGVFRAYAAANTVPGQTYPEGTHWPSAAVSATHTLGPRRRTASGHVRIDHLASRNVVIRPGDQLTGTGWRLRVRVDGPRRRTSPTAYLLVQRVDGTLRRLAVPLDEDGVGSRRVDLDPAQVQRAILTLANASTRYDCWEQDFTYACQGVPRDQGKRYEYAVRLTRS
jgi:hypothetical protein